MDVVSHPQDSQGGDLGDNWIIEWNPDYMEALSPHSERWSSFSTKMETGNEETPSLVLQMVGIRTGVEEDVRLKYHKKRQNSPENTKYSISPLARSQLSQFP